MSNLYADLEVSETATLDEIKKSYRRLSMLYHPDKNKNNPEATTKFQTIAEAYETLGDLDCKLEYDMKRARMMYPGSNPTTTSMNMNINMNHVNDLFASLFGATFSQLNLHTSKPPPLVQTISIPFESVFADQTIPIEVTRTIVEQQQSGPTENDRNNQNNYKSQPKEESEVLYVSLHQGIDDGEIIVIKGKGHVSYGQPGDVKLTVRLINTTPFVRQGLDLVYEKTITLKEALCGFSFVLPYVTGKQYTINNTSVIRDGYQKKIPNLGIPRQMHMHMHTGHLIIVFHVLFPEQLSANVVDQLRQIEF